ncbi:MAG: proline dehydrogenase [Parvicellaceae bacterium]|jgi:proline dehydrogenase
MVSFDNTEIAFKGKSNVELKRAHKLFKMVSSNSMVSFGKWATNVALAIRFPIRGMVKATIFKQFCGGETIAECDRSIKDLWAYRVGTILDYSVEGKESEEDFEHTCAEIIRTVDRSNREESIPFSVFKVTGVTTFALLEKLNIKADLSLDESRQKSEFYDRVDRICSAARNANTPVFIDAEESWIQDAIDEVAEKMMAKHNTDRAIVYTTTQMYRWDRLAYIKNLHASAKGKYFLGLKLVRGAYMEKERARAEELDYKSPIQPGKDSCDKDYNDALEYCVLNIKDMAICAGSHNEESAMILTKLMEEHGVQKEDERIYFAQLLGMSDHISFNLSNDGYKVAKYVPYGPVKEVLPYLLRRAEENTSVAGQTTRELSLITSEIERRRARK